MGHPDRPLAGATALVTGAARRLGRAIALALAGQGAGVVVHYNTSADAAGETAEQVRAAGAKCWTVQADLADPAAAEGLFGRAVEQAGPIDILVNNASIFPAGDLLETTPDEIALNVQVHATAPLQLSRALAAQQRGGHIVNLLDARIADHDRSHAAYHLSKRVLLALTRMLALELAPRIAVNAVAPGLILPPPGEDDSYLAKLANTNPMGRHGAPRDVAEAVIFLVTSRFITGQIIFVDGGRHMRGSVHG